MAIVRVGPIAQQITGSIAGVTFSQTRHGQTVGKRPRKTAGTSTALLSHQAHIANLTHKWISLSPARQLAWRALAARLTHTNRLGNRIRWNPLELFIHERILTIKSGLFFYPDPPHLATPIPIQQITTTTLSTNPSVHVFPMLTPNPGACWLWYHRPFASHATQPQYWTYIGHEAGPSPWTFDLNAVFTNLLGFPTLGELVHFRAVSQMWDNLRSQPFRADVTVA